MNTDLYWMTKALEMANRCQELDEVPVGAIVVFNDRPIAAAHNRRETDRDPTAHAEILALRAAAKAVDSWRLTGCTLYVTLEPCPMCAGALVLSRLDRVVFGAWDERAGSCGSLYDIPGDPALNHHVEITGGVLEAECARLLREYYAIKRNR